jgi:site-specific DNA-cytosine methylase
MGCLEIALGELGKLDLTKQRMLVSEIDEKTREVYNQVHKCKERPNTKKWPNDIMDIAEGHVRDLGKNKVILFAGGAPCGDHSSKRNMRLRDGTMPTTDQRPGFKGRNGKVFKQLIRIWKWVKKYNPDCDHFIENVVFKDTEDWKTVCKVFGKPIILNSKEVSYTARRRAYWLSFNVPDRGIELAKEAWLNSEPNPDDCMDAGRTLVRTKTGRDELVIKPLGKSWGFRDGKLVEDTSKPLWVRQKGMKYLQYIRANEAEQLHGLQKGITGEQLKPSQRLKSIGNGWDIRAVKVLLKYWVPTKIMVKRTKSTRCHFSARRRACTIKTDRRKLHGKYLSRNKAYILRGISKKQESSYDFVHDALSHLSKSMLEKCCRYEVIKGLPKFDFDEIKDHNCFSCDKAQQRVPDSCKEMPEEFKAQFPMQHIYADIGTINAGDACGGLVDIVCFREFPGKIRGYYPVETPADVPKMLNLFLKEHFQIICSQIIWGLEI